MNVGEIVAVHAIDEVVHRHSSAALPTKSLTGVVLPARDARES
jgi:hypothetical protein